LAYLVSEFRFFFGIDGFPSCSKMDLEEIVHRNKAARIENYVMDQQANQYPSQHPHHPNAHSNAQYPNSRFYLPQNQNYPFNPSPSTRVPIVNPYPSLLSPSSPNLPLYPPQHMIPYGVLQATCDHLISEINRRDETIAGYAAHLHATNAQLHHLRSSGMIRYHPQLEIQIPSKRFVSQRSQQNTEEASNSISANSRVSNQEVGESPSSSESPRGFISNEDSSLLEPPIDSTPPSLDNSDHLEESLNHDPRSYAVPMPWVHFAPGLHEENSGISVDERSENSEQGLNFRQKGRQHLLEEQETDEKKKEEKGRRKEKKELSSQDRRNLLQIIDQNPEALSKDQKDAWKKRLAFIETLK